MDKRLLKSVLQGLTPGTRITVELTDTTTSTGIVDTVEKGRGQGGSWKVRATNTETQEPMFVSTIHNDKVNAITVENGETIRSSPMETTPTTVAVARAKVIFKTLKTLELPTSVRVQATTPDLSGEFTLRAVRQRVGRIGQIDILLADSTGAQKVVSSYKHAEVIVSIAPITS